MACDDAELAELAALDVGGEVTLLALGGERGVGAALRAIHVRAPHADVMLVGEGVLVGPGWLEGLREAAHLDSIVMTASPLSEPGADELAVDALAGAVLNASLGSCTSSPTRCAFALDRTNTSWTAIQARSDARSPSRGPRFAG